MTTQLKQQMKWARICKRKELVYESLCLEEWRDRHGYIYRTIRTLKYIRSLPDAQEIISYIISRGWKPKEIGDNDAIDHFKKLVGETNRKNSDLISTMLLTKKLILPVELIRTLHGFLQLKTN